MKYLFLEGAEYASKCIAKF